MSETEIVKDCLNTLAFHGFSIPRVLLMDNGMGKKKRVTVWTDGKKGRAWRMNTGFLGTAGGGRMAVGVVGAPDILGWIRIDKEVPSPFGPGARYQSKLLASLLFGIECKSDKGKQSPAQVEFQQALERDGGIYILVRSAEELERELRTRGIAP